jgi:hypothetical protein
MENKSYLAYLEYIKEQYQSENEKEWARRADIIYRAMAMKILSDKRKERIKEIWK